MMTTSIIVHTLLALGVVMSTDAALPKRCGCEGEGERFCNHDDGEGRGFCEPCSNFASKQACLKDGLPRLGEISCQHFCFNVQTPLPSPPPTGKQLCKLLRRTIAVSVGPFVPFDYCTTRCRFSGYTDGSPNLGGLSGIVMSCTCEKEECEEDTSVETSAPAPDAALPKRCGCEGEGEKFCNHDDGEGRGFCELCSNFASKQACLSDGLPRLGEISCQHFCFNVPTQLPTPPPTGKQLCKLVEHTIAVSVGPFQFVPSDYCTRRCQPIGYTDGSPNYGGVGTVVSCTCQKEECEEDTSVETSAPTPDPTKAPSPAPTPAPTELPAPQPSDKPCKDVRVRVGTRISMVGMWWLKGCQNACEQRGYIYENKLGSMTIVHAWPSYISSCVCLKKVCKDDIYAQPLSPTDSPTQAPTNSPTQAPTDSPTQSPTDSPTQAPTDSPTPSPTESPTQSPTDSPTASAKLGLNGKCWPKGSTMQERDDACEGDLVCARTGYDGRSFGGCNDQYEPASRGSIKHHCCTALPSGGVMPAKLGLNGKCWPKGSTMQERDDACEGDLVCARTGYDGRSFGGCNDQYEPASRGSIKHHCCTALPSAGTTSAMRRLKVEDTTIKYELPDNLRTPEEFCDFAVETSICDAHCVDVRNEIQEFLPEGLLDVCIGTDMPIGDLCSTQCASAE